MFWKIVVNALSTYRFVAAFVVVPCITTGHWLPTLVLLIGGFVTDLLDGYLARIKHASTRFGYWWDVVCDKTLVISPVLGMAIVHDIWWPIAIVLLVLIYPTQDYAPNATQVADGLIWGACYTLTVWGMLHHVMWQTSAVFLVCAVIGLGVGAATHDHIARFQQQTGIK